MKEDREIGRHAVLRKWPNYRERDILGRALTLEEVDGLTATIRRLAALRLLEPALDANYAAVAADATPWNDAAPPSTALAGVDADRDRA